MMSEDGTGWTEAWSVKVVTSEMIPRLPRYHDIGPRRYKIIRVPAMAGGVALGETSIYAEEIRLAPQINNRATARVFLHEDIHAINEEYEIELTENQVSRLANGLCASLQALGFYPTELKLAEDP